MSVVQHDAPSVAEYHDDSGWIDVSMINGWCASASWPQARRRTDGVIEFRGHMELPAWATLPVPPCFVLPPELRPDEDIFVQHSGAVVAIEARTGVVRLTPTSDITPNGGGLIVQLGEPY